jgi:hypothetical protein
MSLPKIIAGTLLAGSLAVGGVALAGPAVVKSNLGSFQIASSDEVRGEDRDRDEYGWPTEGEVLGLRDLAQQLSEKGYGEIRKIERDGARYEVKARDRDGQWRELDVDARTGRILAEEDDD